MSPQPCSKPQVDRIRLASYFSLGVTGALMATADSEAAIVMIDLTNVAGNNITGVNGGVTYGTYRSIYSWLGAGTGQLEIYNGEFGVFGLDGDAGLYLAINGGPSSPRNFGAGATIDGSAAFSEGTSETVFGIVPFAVGPDFGANSFMGFRFGTAGNYYFGYLEVTWSSSTNTFQILSGAYESTANQAILAGATAAVPVPAASLLALMALGGNSFRRSRTRAA